MQSFSESPVNFSDGQINVSKPPNSTLENGFIPRTTEARGQPLPAQWLNWLFRTVFRYINRDKVSDANGVGLFTIPDSFIKIEAIDKSDTNKYLVAIGYKGNIDVTHTLKVIQSSTLTLGTATADGNQPISGGSNVIIRASSRQFGEL